MECDDYVVVESECAGGVDRAEPPAEERGVGEGGVGGRAASTLSEVNCL